MTFTQAANSTPIPARTWVAIVTLGLSGQIAWNVENSWFNTFVYDTITPDSRPIAVMVGVSALVATVTTLVVGSWSDALGRRKPIIVAGYLLWALSTAIFPVAALPHKVGVAVFLAIALDAVMTLFGSSANDAAFNAWVTDVTKQGNRGVVEGVLQALPVLATMIGMGVSGFVIDRIGYTPFFLILGGLVLAMGMLGGAVMRDDPRLVPALASEAWWRHLVRLLSPASIRANADLFLVLTTMCLFSISLQVTAPYEVIYLNNTVGLSKGEVGVIVALVAPVLVVFALPIGWLTDRGHGIVVAFGGYLVAAIGVVGFSFAHSFVVLAVFGVLKSVGYLMMIVMTAWYRNLLPADSRGSYQGVRMIFVVLVPMVVGSAIGSVITQLVGQDTVINGSPGTLVPAAIYWVSAALVLTALVPVTVLRMRARVAIKS